MTTPFSKEEGLKIYSTVAKKLAEAVEELGATDPYMFSAAILQAAVQTALFLGLTEATIHKCVTRFFEDELKSETKGTN